MNVLGVNVLGFGVWTLIYTAPRWDALVLDMVRPVWRSFPDRARPRRAALYASYGLLVGFHTLAFWKTMRRLGTVPVAVSKGTQQALPFLLSHILFCHSARDDAHLFRGDPNL